MPLCANDQAMLTHDNSNHSYIVISEKPLQYDVFKWSHMWPCDFWVAMQKIVPYCYICIYAHVATMETLSLVC